MCKYTCGEYRSSYNDVTTESVVVGNDDVTVQFSLNCAARHCNEIMKFVLCKLIL